MALLILHVLQLEIKNCDNVGSMQSAFIKNGDQTFYVIEIEHNLKWYKYICLKNIIMVIEFPVVCRYITMEN